MPTYCYSDKNGAVVEEVHHVGEAPEKVTRDGREFTRDIAAEQRFCADIGCFRRPFHSEAVGCLVQQVPERREELRKLGCPTEFDRRGRAIITSRKHMQQLARLHGLREHENSDRTLGPKGVQRRRKRRR